MNGVMYQSVELDPHLKARASEVGLVLPEIGVADKLDLRLGRQDRTIEIDNDALFSGIQEAELENQVKINIDSLPKDENDSTPQIEFTDTDTTRLRISPKPIPEIGLARKLNQAFWLGVLVTDEVMEGNKYKYEDELHTRKNKLKKQEKWLPNAVGMGVGLSDDLTTIVSNGQLSTNIKIQALSLGAQIATFIFLSIHYKKRIGSSTTAVELMQDKLTPQAKELATHNKVLNYGDRIASDMPLS